MLYRGFSKRQMIAMTWWNRPGLRRFDAIICDGAVRSGKTVSMTVGFFLWAMCSFSGQSFGICGRSITALRRNIVQNLPSWLGGLMQLQGKVSRNQLTVRWGDHENVFYLFGGVDESAYKQIQGVTLAGVLLDEVALMPRSFVEQACARCSVPGSRLWFNCNPAGPEHWFYREWIRRRKQKNAVLVHFTMEDNPFLSPEIRQRYERLYTGVFYQRYILGLWCAAQGRIYDFDPGRHLCTPEPVGGEYYISVDYGTQNPFSAGLWWVGKDYACRLREFYYSGRDTGKPLTDEEYHDALEQLAGDKPVRQVIIDPSAASFIALLRRKGRFAVRKARNEVLPGIRLVASYLQKGLLRFTPQCADTIREFSLYSWEEDGTKDRPKKQDDHAMDDIRYFCATVLRRKFTSEVKV